MPRTIQTTQRVIPPGVIDFSLGQPDATLLPLDLFRQATEHRFSYADSLLLQYGAEQGDGYLRLALADYLTKRYPQPVEPDHLFLTNGISPTLDLICTLFTKPGDVIFVEEPAYFLAFQIFYDHGLRVVGIPTDEQGLNVAALEEQLQTERPALVYTIPTFQNPTGYTMPLARRQRLVELAQQHEFLVVADEVYHFLSYSDEPVPPPLASFAQTGHVLALGSFSKIMAPGLRVGWVQARPALVNRLTYSGVVQSGGGLNPIIFALVRDLLELGLQDEQLTFLRQTYAARIQAMHAALQEHLGDQVRYVTPTGGYFFWLHTPQVADTAQLISKAQAEQVGFQPGIKFSSRLGLRDYFRLSFAQYEIPAIEEGIARLGRVFARS
jgi:2-aminoadipate transaminase